MSGEQNGTTPAGVPVQLDPTRSLIITILPNGQMSANVPPDEMMARFLVDKLRAMVDDEMRARAMRATTTAPRVWSPGT